MAKAKQQRVLKNSGVEWTNGLCFNFRTLHLIEEKAAKGQNVSALNVTFGLNF